MYKHTATGTHMYVHADTVEQVPQTEIPTVTSLSLLQLGRLSKHMHIYISNAHNY